MNKEISYDLKNDEHPSDREPVKSAKSKKHDIYKRDPETLYNYVYKQVEITCSTNDVFRGRVYTVDPVSYSFILFDCSSSPEKEGKRGELFTMVIGHNILDVQIIDDDVNQELIDKMDNLFNEPKINGLEGMSHQQIKERKAKLVEWFRENHIQLQESKRDEQILTLNDLVDIKPPYTKDDIFCTNPRVLDKILELMEKFCD